MNIKNKLMHTLRTHCRLSVLIAAALVVTGTIIYTSLAATTVGTNFSTDGNLTVNGNTALGSDSSDTVTVNGVQTINVGATNSVTIDAATTDHTANANGVLKISVDSSMANTDGATGNEITMTRRSTGGALGSLITIDGASSAMTLADSTAVGQKFLLRGSASDTQGEYIGQTIATYPGSTPGGAAAYTGITTLFDSNYGAASLQSTGNVTGMRSMINKTGGANTAEVIGIANYVENSATGVVDLYGMVSGIKLNNVTPSNISAGIWVREYSGASNSGVLKDGILVTSDNGSAGRITDGLDVSATAITNAINLGTNKILGSGSFSIDLLNAAANDTLTITNSNATYESHLSVEGNVMLGTSSATHELDIWDAGTTTIRASSTNSSRGGCLILKDTTNSTEYGVVISGGVLGTTSATNCS